MNKHQYNPACTFQVIELPSGENCLVSTEDFELVRPFHWISSHRGYAYCNGVAMHRLIMGLTDDSILEVHHKDDNRLNNTRENLVVLNRSSHVITRGLQANNTTGFKGVHERRPGVFRARLIKNKKKINLGCYATPEEAARAYDKAAKQHFGANAYLNFSYANS
jgi:hypothetical protein